MSLNKIFLQGRLCKDVTLRRTTTGTPVASFSLACERDFKDKQTGEKQTDFIDVIAWRSTGEFVSRYFTKGRMAIVVGRLQMRDYTDRDGNKRTAAEVVADTVYFGDSKRDDGGGYSTTTRPHSAAPAGSYSAPPSGESQFAELDDDGELPF